MPRMDALPKSLFLAAQVRELDRRAMDALAVTGAALMERAGVEAFARLRAHWPQARRLCVACGAGNNGGDGYVIARLAREAGLTVQLLQVGDAGRIQGDAATARDAWLAAGGSEETFAGHLPEAADLIVDAVMGTGLDRTLEGRWREAVAAINAHPAPVFAVDIPSGLAADTGAVLGAAVRADLTVTFIGLKLGLFTGAGPACRGALEFAGLGVPVDVVGQLTPAAQLLQPDDLKAWLPPRERTAHKGRFGHVLVIGGNHGMPGAVRLAGAAALRAGAGLVTVATRTQHVAAVVSGRPELMCRGVEDVADLEPLLARASVLVLGPGLGRDPWAQAMFARAVGAGLPTLLDADALSLSAESGLPGGDWILTPHPGEAGRLLGGSIESLEADRPRTVRQIAERYQATVVLKGAGSLVCDRAGTLSVCMAGNPGMASAGMGDVLSGVIAGLRAQGLDAYTAARAGVLAHALAADRAAASGERGLVASDVVAELRAVVNPV